MRRLIPCLLILLILAACGGEEPVAENRDLIHKPWSEIETLAKDTKVRFYMYGGFAHVNKWIDTYVSPEVKERYGITLVRVPMDAGVFVNKLLTEHQAGKEQGSIDLLWINGENFKATKEAGTLFGPFANALPNFDKFVDKNLAAYDFGFPVDGYEAPYGRAQFVFEYDPARMDAPPKSFNTLLQWVKDHPGQFTYPQPPDFTGSAFIRQAFYAVTGGPEQYMKGFDQALFDEKAPLLWKYLNELKPYLWQEGKSYPKSSAELDTLFARGALSVNMSYHPLHAQTKILEGAYPASVRTFIMNEGSLFNLHFTAIPANAPNKAGAMVVSNFLLSPEVQLSKLNPLNWGDFPAIEVSRLPIAMRDGFNDIDLGEPTLSAKELSRVAVPEIPAPYLEALEAGWEAHVLR